MFPQLSPQSTIGFCPRHSEPEASSGRNQSPQSELVHMVARIGSARSPERWRQLRTWGTSGPGFGCN